MSLILSKKIYDTKNIPKVIGIYYFIDDNNIPIYIGKSLNIKKRIQQHLNSKSLKSDKIKIDKDSFTEVYEISVLVSIFIISVGAVSGW